MNNILIGRDTDLKIHYHHALAGHHYEYIVDGKRSNKLRDTVRDMLSLLASNEHNLPSDLNDITFYSVQFGRHVTINAPELVSDFILNKRSKFRYDYTPYKPYKKPDDSEFVSYFLRALQSLKTRLETNRDGERVRLLEAKLTDISHQKRIYCGVPDAKWFGAKGDGVTDNTDAFQAAINFSNKATYAFKR